MENNKAFNVYQDIATDKLVFSKEDSDLYLVALLNEESGEVSKLFRKHVEKKTAVPREDLTLELGDVLWTVACIAKMHGITMQEVVTGNLDKLEERGLIV